MKRTLSILFSFALLPLAARAELVDFSCGNLEFNLDIDRSTMNGEPVSWAREGDWLTWMGEVGSKMGVNLRDGSFRQYDSNEISPPGNCFPPDAAAFDGSTDPGFLEAAFVSRSVDDRQWLQTVLRETNLYSGPIDGIWGDGTSLALLSFCAVSVNSTLDANGCLDSVAFAFAD